MGGLGRSLVGREILCVDEPVCVGAADGGVGRWRCWTAAGRGEEAWACATQVGDDVIDDGVIGNEAQDAESAWARGTGQGSRSRAHGATILLRRVVWRGRPGSRRVGIVGWVRGRSRRRVACVGRCGHGERTLDFMQRTKTPDGQEFWIHLIPDRSKEEECLSAVAVREGFATVERYLRTDRKAGVKGVERVAAYFDTVANCYVVCHVEYADGTDTSVA